MITQINNIVKENLGHKFGDDEVDEALKQFRLEINTDIEMLQHKEYEEIQSNGEKKKIRKDKTKETEPEEKIWTIEHQFKDGKWEATFDLYKKLIKELHNKELKFNENPTKFYISLISDKSNFCQIHGQKSALKIWLNLDIKDISEQASLNVRDVSNIGHWGLGNIECVVKNELDFVWLIPLIQKAYEK